MCNECGTGTRVCGDICSEKSESWRDAKDAATRGFLAVYETRRRLAHFAHTLGFTIARGRL
jgi:hypothetical protein